MHLSASMTSVDPLNMGAALVAVAPHVGSWHVDVMDGTFAPAFGFGPSMVAALVAQANAPVDVHLMIDRPDIWAPQFAAMGVRSVSFHVETGVNVHEVMQAIKANGAEAFVALRPETPIKVARPFFDDADGCLLLTAPPGGGAFDERAFDKAFDLPEHLLTIVDGRIDEPHFAILKAADITDVVIGQALFGGTDLHRRAADLSGQLAATPPRPGTARRIARPPHRRPPAETVGDHLV